MLVNIATEQVDNILRHVSNHVLEQWQLIKSWKLQHNQFLFSALPSIRVEYFFGCKLVGPYRCEGILQTGSFLAGNNIGVNVWSQLVLDVFGNTTLMNINWSVLHHFLQMSEPLICIQELLIMRCSLVAKALSDK